MPSRIDLLGRRFDRLQVLAFDHSNGRPFWLCRCDCGKRKVIFGGSLRSGAIKSCGCLNQERKTVHGLYGTRDNRIWVAMRFRCSNPRHKFYNRYGGRGIKVCAEWDLFQSFHNWAIENGYDDSKELHRINIDGDYEPSNCTWLTRSEHVALHHRMRRFARDGRATAAIRRGMKKRPGVK